MTNRLLLGIAITASLLAGCKDKKTDAAGGGKGRGDGHGDGHGGGGGGGGGAGGGAGPVAAAAKLVTLDASAAGEEYKGWTLTAPEGAVAKEDFGALAVTDGKGFQLEVHGGTVDMAARKKEIEANDVNKLKRFITDAPDTLVYESDPGMGGVQVHFLAAVKVGDADYSCENTKGPTYNKAQIDAMLAACRSIKK